MEDGREDQLLQSVALQNANAILRARQRAEEELLAAKEALWQSNERVTNIVESITDGLIVLDKWWRFTYLNGKGEEILLPLGISREQVVGMDFWDVFADLRDTHVGREYLRAVNDQVAVELETFYEPLKSWFEVRVFPARDGVSIYFLDITRRKSAEEALRRSEEMLRATFNQAAVAMAVATLDGRFIEVNKRFTEFIGYSPKELAALTFLDITHPADVAVTRDRWRSLMAGENAHYVLQKRFLRKNGQAAWSHTSVALLRDADGAPNRLIGVVEDITARKAAEEELRLAAQFNRSIIDSSTDCIKTLSLDGILLWMSEGGQRVLCIENVQQLIGTSWVNLWKGEDRDAAVTALRRAALGGAGSFVGNYPVHGQSRWWNIAVTPMLDAKGKPETLLAISRDITDRVLAEEDRKHLLASEQAARADAEHASHMKDEFLATQSHELRTPLSSILGWTHILKTGKVGEADLAKGLDTIERNARMQKQLIEDLLDMSRITSGKVRLDVQPVVPSTFIEAALETVQPAADAKGVRIERTLEVDTGPIKGDPGRLQQVVWNLLINAIKFTPEGGAVKVALARTNSHAEVSITDTGVGIDPQFLVHVFERFRQADASATRQYEGLGLGLSIVKHLVELHGGKVRAESDGIGHGAKFIVELPLAGGHGEVFDATRSQPRLPAYVAPDFTPIDLSGIKVLVVDDHEDARELIARVLSQSQAEVVSASSAAEALQVLASAQPDILVSDIGMPDVDGFELLRRARLLDGGRVKIPAIALTAFARSEDRTRALHAGFVAHVSKPVEPAELVATVASVLGRVRASPSDPQAVVARPPKDDGSRPRVR